MTDLNPKLSFNDDKFNLAFVPAITVILNINSSLQKSRRNDFFSKVGVISA
jgi:hypothetical protein